MKRAVLLAALAATFFLVSCNKEPEPVITIESEEYSIPSSGREFYVFVSANVALSVRISGDWIIQKGADDRSYCFKAEPNYNRESRKGNITFYDAVSGLSKTVTVIQGEGSPLIEFKDPVVKEICVSRWDSDKDGELSEREAAAVTEIRAAFMENESITLFEEFRFFTGLKAISQRCFFNCSKLRSIILPEGISSIGKSAFENCTSLTCELVFPEGLTSIGEYAFSSCTSLTGGLVFSKGLVSIGDNVFYECTSLDGTLVLPEGLVSIGEGAFYGCSNLTGNLVIPTTVSSIGAYAFYSCKGFTGDLTIPDSITSLPEGCFCNCSGLTGTLTLPKGIKNIDSGAFSYNAFSKISVLAEETPIIGNAFIGDKECLIFVPKGKATVYRETEGWKTYRTRITEEGHLPSDFFYSSTDYSRDGEVVCLQKATKGMGIDLIFLGDGFTDKDMEPGGYYETTMRRWMEQFFVFEPYRSFRDWFSIYTVKVVSKNSEMMDLASERKLTWDVDEKDEIGNSIIIDVEACHNYAQRVPYPIGQPQKVSVFLNTENSVGRSFCSFNSSGSFLALILESIDNRPTVINHESGGHGFAFLADEYVEREKHHPDPKGMLEDVSKFGWYLNLDWRNDPSTVRWARLLQDPLYSGEGLGIFEGGDLYAYGIFRPTENSLMRHLRLDAVFNAPSREIIYKRIMQLGLGEDWTYDYAEFVKADRAGRQQAAEAYSKRKNTRSSISSDDFEPGLPPILIDDDVKAIKVSGNGQVTLVR